MELRRQTISTSLNSIPTTKKTDQWMDRKRLVWKTMFRSGRISRQIRPRKPQRISPSPPRPRRIISLCELERLAVADVGSAAWSAVKASTRGAAKEADGKDEEEAEAKLQRTGEPVPEGALVVVAEGT